MKTSLLVVDDVLPDPDAVRARALAQTFAPDQRYYQGQRSAAHPTGEHRALFEHLLSRRITKWDYPVNGAYQWCTPEDRLVVHMDTQEWAGILFLTPGAPAAAGTSFYRHKGRGWREDPQHPGELAAIFSGGFFDRTKFEEVDRIGNVYNRLVLWNAGLIHAASEYFGQTLDDARLFQVFFFDTSPA